MTDIENVSVERILIQLEHEINDLQTQINRIRALKGTIIYGGLTFRQIMRVYTECKLDPRITVEEAVRLATLPQ